jgi:hypothetical protein
MTSGTMGAPAAISRDGAITRWLDAIYGGSLQLAGDPIWGNKKPAGFTPAGTFGVVSRSVS